MNLLKSIVLAILTIPLLAVLLAMRLCDSEDNREWYDMWSDWH